MATTLSAGDVSLNGGSDPSAEAAKVDGYKGHPSRFAVIIIFAFANIINAAAWICFAPVVTFAQTRFAASNDEINMLSSVFLIAYVPGSFISVYMLERYGLRAGIVLGCVMNLLCAGIRYAGTFASSPQLQYSLVMIGQCIGGLAQPIFTNSPSRIAGDWFPPSQRDLATIVGAMSNPLGNAIGSLIPTIIMNGPDDMPAMLLYQCIPAGVVLLLAALCVRDEPPEPPSAAAAIRRAARTGAAGHASEHAVALLGADAPHAAASSSAAAALAKLQEDFLLLARNTNFLFLLLCFSMGLGTFNALLTVLAQWIGPCGYGDDIAGYAGAALLGAGLLGAIAIGVALEATRAYVPIMKVGIFTILGAVVFLLAVQRPGQPALLVGAFGVLGACLIPLLPVALENAAECSFPVPEDNSAALLLIGGNMLGLGLTYLMSALVGMPPTTTCSGVVTPVAGMLLACMGSAAVALLFFRKDYRRQAAEAARVAETAFSDVKTA